MVSYYEWYDQPIPTNLKRNITIRYECLVFSGYLIPKGWKILVWFRSVHLDPTIYSNPWEFDPSRWDVRFNHPLLNSRMHNSVVISIVKLMQDFIPKVGSFMPFGLGSRLCPGNDLAKLEIAIFLHHFLLNFRWFSSSTWLLISYYYVVKLNVIVIVVNRVDEIGIAYRLERLNPDSPVMYLPHTRPVDNCLAEIKRIATGWPNSNTY